MTTPRAFSRPVELGLYAVAPLATLATAPILAQGLGTVGRGHYGVAVAVATLAFTVGGWGQGEVLLARARVGGSRYADHARVALTGGVIAGLACFVVLLGLRIPVSTAVVASAPVPALALVGLWQSSAVAQGKLRPLAVSGALVAVLRVAVLALLLGVTLLTASTAVTTFQLAVLLGSLATIGLAQRRGPGAVGATTPTRVLLTSGAAITLFNLLNAILQRADLIVLQALSSAAEVGLYAAPASLTTAALALSAAYKPRLQSAAFGPEPLRRMANEAAQVLALGCLGAVALWFTAPRLVELFFGAEFEAAAPVLRLLGLATVPLLLVDLGYGGLVVLGRRRELVQVAGIGAVVNVAGLALLCPAYGARGAAIALVIAYSAATVVAWWTLVRATGRPAPTSPNV